MRISLILLTIVSTLGCKDIKKNEEPKETRGELMERIEREKERRTPENPILREKWRSGHPPDRRSISSQNVPNYTENAEIPINLLGF